MPFDKNSFLMTNKIRCCLLLSSKSGHYFHFLLSQGGEHQMEEVACVTRGQDMGKGGGGRLVPSRPWGSPHRIQGSGPLTSPTRIHIANSRGQNMGKGGRGQTSSLTPVGDSTCLQISNQNSHLGGAQILDMCDKSEATQNVCRVFNLQYKEILRLGDGCTFFLFLKFK